MNDNTFYKHFSGGHRSTSPIGVTKEWNFTEKDFGVFQNQQEFFTYVSQSYGMSLATIVNMPRFPQNRVNLGVSQSADPMQDFYNVTFSPTYESASGRINPDGTYQRIMHYGIKQQFYNENAPFKYKIESGSKMSEKIFIIEIPRRYVGYGIEPETFEFTDNSNINALPYWNISPYNTTSSNALAINGIKLIDDGYGRIYDNNFTASGCIGNIIYDNGLVFITDYEYATYFEIYLIISGSL